MHDATTETLSARRNQKKEEEKMMSNEVGKIEMGKLNKRQELSSRVADKVLENQKLHSSLQMQKTNAHESRFPAEYHAASFSPVIGNGRKRCQTYSILPNATNTSCSQQL